MLFTRGVSRISRTCYCRRQWAFSSLRNNEQQLVQHDNQFLFPLRSSEEVWRFRAIHSLVSSALSGVGQQAHDQSSSVIEKRLDPFSPVADESQFLRII
ncbi:solanesyl diphosphate synthase 3, chloroplastic/mitochondrial-like isoform X1 [Olea europaea var. sylvestris]|uniref:solanesyl diphosphate synthase 3, chloroplastic/mitochondrial-like isoform X1 n=1 Tax=Olea europaea var. sylvestris TaxID=158386 RepID=UPI000C1D0B92|nr:solanesyl diphosphate synthase 3, chloroplastic/mitochondrial-like isoform X1 [Olea europaea var. sylvestris]